MHPHWENPEVTGYGRLPSRPELIPFPTRREAARGGASPWLKSLDGRWRFKRLASPAAAPRGWARAAYRDGGWQQVPVPGLWTMADTVDGPIYTNVLMPFGEEPPEVPAVNPTGLYRRRFTVPRARRKRRVVLRVGGAESCCYVFCNGEEVGFSKDSRLPAEFDLTPYLRTGPNALALMVTRWSDASHIEDQDQWWHAGLHRSVYLYSTEAVHIRDVHASPTLEDDLRAGNLDATVRLGASGREAVGYRVEGRLLDPQGKTVWSASARVEPASFYPVAGEGNLVRLTGTVRRPRLWSAETPQLYRLVISLRQSRRSVEHVGLRVGFRRIDIKGRELRVNGKAVLIRGVNRHDHSDKTGKVLDEDLWRLDIETMKRHNVNAVRTSHYPNDSRFYELCDEYGLYVIDECNIEAHHHYSKLGRDPYWATAFVNRIVRLVERDKNHPSIIAWSLGNETGFGANHMAMVGWLRAYDPTRPIHNENAINDQAKGRMWNDNRDGSDLVCPMYPSVADIVAFAEVDDPRPLIMCEYAHAMGNSCGNLKEYWDAIEQHHGLQGGFIWEWLDHGIAARTEDGEPYWAYGGDFGETVHDANFVCDGLCWPDRTPHSSLVEYKKVIQPVRVERVRGARFRIVNKYDFLSLRHLRGTWELLLDGDVVKSGKLRRLTAAPGDAETVILPFEAPRLEAGQELSIVFRFCLASAAAWAEEGHEVAFEQLTLGVRRAGAPKYRKATALRSIPTGTTIGTGSGDLHVDDGGAVSWSLGGAAVLGAGPELNLWRAPMDNDGIKLKPRQQRQKAWAKWLDAGLDDLRETERRLQVRFTRGGTTLLRDSRHVAGTSTIRFESRYEVYGEGAAVVRHRFDIPDEITDLPRVGVRWVLPEGFEDLRWYGRGPHETYADRRESGLLAVHESTVGAQYVPYILPQDHGNLTDVRWLEVRNRRGISVRFKALGPMQASASHYPHEVLTPATHTYEVEPVNETYVSLDAAVRGVGGASCGPDTLPQYRVGAGSYELAYAIEVTQISS